jgi:hypothetical protein
MAAKENVSTSQIQDFLHLFLQTSIPELIAPQNLFSTICVSNILRLALVVSYFTWNVFIFSNGSVPPSISTTVWHVYLKWHMNGVFLEAPSLRLGVEQKIEQTNQLIRPQIA